MTTSTNRRWIGTNLSTIAASSIQGTGAQNFSSAMRNGCTLVSGIAFGPNFFSLTEQTERRQIDQPHAIRVGREQPVGYREGNRGFADPARPDDSQKTLLRHLLG